MTKPDTQKALQAIVNDEALLKQVMNLINAGDTQQLDSLLNRKGLALNAQQLIEELRPISDAELAGIAAGLHPLPSIRPLSV